MLIVMYGTSVFFAGTQYQIQQLTQQPDHPLFFDGESFLRMLDPSDFAQWMRSGPWQHQTPLQFLLIFLGLCDHTTEQLGFMIITS